jgi:hypothetical protein
LVILPGEIDPIYIAAGPAMLGQRLALSPLPGSSPDGSPCGFTRDRPARMRACCLADSRKARRSGEISASSPKAFLSAAASHARRAARVFKGFPRHFKAKKSWLRDDKGEIA